MCTSVPAGPIQIIDSRFIYVDCHGSNVPYAGGHTDPNTVYQNFKQDCHYFKLHGVTYEQYIVSLIDEMIDQLDCAEANVLKSVDSDISGVITTNSQERTDTVDIGGANSLPLKIQGNFALAIDDDRGNSYSSDYSIPNKTRGFLFHESGDFQFIGPDREAIDIEMVNQCINIADIVRKTNKPNYQQARFPLNSGLNLQACTVCPRALSWGRSCSHYTLPPSVKLFKIILAYVSTFMPTTHSYMFISHITMPLRPLID